MDDRRPETDDDDLFNVFNADGPSGSGAMSWSYVINFNISGQWTGQRTPHDAHVHTRRKRRFDSAKLNGANIQQMSEQVAIGKVNADAAAG